MIEADKRKAIFLLHEEGMGVGEISQCMNVDKKSVRVIIQQEGVISERRRKDKIMIDEDLLRQLYIDCKGWKKRIHEKLIEEHGIAIAYSTLTQLIREYGFGQTKKSRCGQVPDVPGAEMQHDTTVYTIKLGDKNFKLVCSLLYFRYSKRRYMKFYHLFNRFKMKCFFHEALTFFGYSAKFVIIDNTNLARLRGTGRNAIIVPEMKEFAKQYGFEFICHEKGHANRKAGEERSFYTVETNFLPGRKFESLEDLNQQGFEWATHRMSNRPVSKTGLIPAKAFEYEQSFLVKLPPFIPAPYHDYQRSTDQYGYIAFDGNYYWIPGSSRGDVKVLQYSDSLQLYISKKLIASYQLPPHGVKNKRFYPEGSQKPKYKPKRRSRPTAAEEEKLRALGKEVDTYLDFALKPKGQEKHRVVRQLFSLSQKIAKSIFVKTIQRALTYRITDMKTVQRIAILQMTDGDYEIPYVEIDEQLQDREAYREGCTSDKVDLAKYDEMLEEDNDDG